MFVNFKDFSSSTHALAYVLLRLLKLSFDKRQPNYHPSTSFEIFIKFHAIKRRKPAKNFYGSQRRDFKLFKVKKMFQVVLTPFEIY